MLDPDERVALTASARQIHEDGRLPVLVFCDSAYADVLLNWLLHCDQVGRTGHVLVVATDRALGPWLRDRGVTAVDVTWNGRLPSLWQLRTEAFRALLEEGLPFVHSDADAVWTGDAIAALDGLDHDLVASQGTIWPPDALSTCGAVACCGFFLLRPTPAGRELLDQTWQRQMQDPGRDDQAALNRSLAAFGVAFEPPGGWIAELPFRDQRLRLHDEVVEAEGRGGLRVALLPASRWQRLPNPHAAIVVHHLAEKNARSKREELRKAGALRLRSDWREVEWHADDLQPLVMAGNGGGV